MDEDFYVSAVQRAPKLNFKYKTNGILQQFWFSKEKFIMRKPSMAFAAACFATATAASATELAPLDAHIVSLSPFDGVVYYTVEQEGYRVVATMASGPEAPPVRFIATLQPGQKMLISVPREAGQPAIDVEIRRDEDMLVVGGPNPAATVDLVRGVETGIPPK